MNPSQQHGAVTGYLTWTLRLEGLAVLISAVLCYKYMALASWEIFFLFFFVPDVSFSGYLLGKKAGALFYNIMHSYITPLLASILFWYLNHMDLNYIVVIWIAHIGFDRALGYGLKYFEGFHYTHLGKIKMGFGKQK